MTFKKIKKKEFPSLKIAATINREEEVTGTHVTKGSDLLLLIFYKKYY